MNVFALWCMSIRDCHKTVLNIEQLIYCLTSLIDSYRLSGHFSRPTYSLSLSSVRSLCAFSRTFLLVRLLDEASHFVNSGLEYV